MPDPIGAGPRHSHEQYAALESDGVVLGREPGPTVTHLERERPGLTVERQGQLRSQPERRAALLGELVEHLTGPRHRWSSSPVTIV